MAQAAHRFATKDPGCEAGGPADATPAGRGCRCRWRAGRRSTSLAADMAARGRDRRRWRAAAATARLSSGRRRWVIWRPPLEQGRRTAQQARGGAALPAPGPGQGGTAAERGQRLLGLWMGSPWPTLAPYGTCAPATGSSTA